MVWFLLAIAALAAVYLAGLFIKGDIPAVVRALRWLIGGSALAGATIFALGGRMSVASILGLVAAAILMRGRLGPIDFTTTGTAPGTKSKVRSALFEMQLDHDSGDLQCRIVSGRFSGSDLIDIDEDGMRQLLDDAASDPDSLSLLETWLDARRPGWREHLGMDPDSGSEDRQQTAPESKMDEKQACDILGIEMPASPEEIKAAHRRLLTGVHPDQGGSTFLAARINAAKDYLLKK